MAANQLRALWHYRGFILGCVRREFQAKYRQSLLGAGWTVLNPLAMILVYTVIFAQVMHSRLPGVDATFAYSIHLCAGILTWGLFAEIVSRAQGVFLENANLLKKLSFPRICLPIIVVLNAVLNFSIIFCLFIGFLVISGNFPGWSFFGVFPVLLIEIIFSIGLGITLGVLNVFFRDVGQFFSIALQFWFWLTPIVYPLSLLPAPMRDVIAWNPMVAPISAYQGIFVSGVWPLWSTLVPLSLLGLALCALGMLLFRRHAGEMVDEL